VLFECVGHLTMPGYISRIYILTWEYLAGFLTWTALCKVITRAAYEVRSNDVQMLLLCLLLFDERSRGTVARLSLSKEERDDRSGRIGA
jgi:hypothetical protein